MPEQKSGPVPSQSAEVARSFSYALPRPRPQLARNGSAHAPGAA